MEVSEFLSALGAMVPVLGLLLAGFRHLRGSLEAQRKETSQKIGEMHKKIDDVKEKFVRKDDMLGHIDRLERGVDSLRSDMGELRGTMDDNTRQILTALSRKQ